MKARNFFQFFLILAILASFSSCRTVRVIEQVPVYVYDTAYVATLQHDSIHIDHFREVTKTINDTVYVRDSTVIFRWRLKTDTAYRYIERPVTISKKETVEVKKPLRWWQKGLMWAGAIGIIIALAAVAVRILCRRTS